MMMSPSIFITVASPMRRLLTPKLKQPRRFLSLPPNRRIRSAMNVSPTPAAATFSVAQSITHRIQHRQRNLPYDGKIPLASYYCTTKRVAVTVKEVTSSLRWHANTLQSQTGIKASDISARSLRAGGAMSLLCADVDSITISSSHIGTVIS